MWGEPVAFIANGTDPDADVEQGATLTYTWSLNGATLGATTGPKLTIALQPSDSLTVTVRDAAEFVSSPAPAGCTGRHRPTVQLTCPTAFSADGPTEVAATGADADDPEGDGPALRYTWKVNGAVVTGQRGPTASLRITSGDTISVTATDTDGLVSAVTESDCTGDTRPTVALTCPTPIVWGESTTFTATAVDPDGGSLHFIWTRNDQAVTTVSTLSATSSAAEITVSPGDVRRGVGGRPDRAHVHLDRASRAPVRLGRPLRSRVRPASSTVSRQPSKRSAPTPTATRSRTAGS